MAIIAENNGGGGNYAPIEAGTYAARCYSMVHIGTCEEEVQGVKKMLNKVRISWELPTELKVFKPEDGEKPQVVSKEFTLSMHEKSTLRIFLKSWRGKDFTDEEAKAFDITVLLGKPCMLSVIHKTSKTGKTYAEIANVSTLMKGIAMPEQINPTFEFSVSDYNQAKFELLPQFLKDKVMKSEEYKKMELAEASIEMTKQAMAQDWASKSQLTDDSDMPF